MFPYFDTVLDAELSTLRALRPDPLVEAHPTPVPALDRVAGPPSRVSARGYAVEGTTLTARWVTCLGGALRVRIEDALGNATVETLEDLNRTADRDPNGIAARVLRAVEGLAGVRS